MNVLVINGSPRGKQSNTYKLARAFWEGMGQEANASGIKFEMEEIQVSRLELKSCLGCFSCWSKTPGKCCIQDDMKDVLEKILWADVTIWSFPLYYYTVPGGVKNLIDRQLPLTLPFMIDRKDGVGNGDHATRYDMSGKKTVVISTCGFYTAEGNYDGVCSLFDHMCGKNQYETIFCGQGELFREQALVQRTNEYLGYVREAGKEYVKGGISETTKKKLCQLLYPKETYEQWADASWAIDADSGEKESDALIFTRQMAALYRTESFSGKELVLEMYYTDLDECYQVVMGKEGSTVLTDGSVAATTRIETPFPVWLSISAGEIRGEEALMQQLYKVKGDFNLLMKWDDYFGSVGGSGGQQKAPENNTENRKLHIPSKETNMNIMLIPWMAFWIFVSINGYIGSLVTIGVCAIVQLIFYQNKKTLYDILSGAFVTMFSIAAIIGISERIVVPLSYLSFGIMWTATCFCKIPLTAYYSMNHYNGADALKNPLFIKTNWILTLMWGILYLITPVWTYLLLGTNIAPLTGAVNSILPIFMGIFTVWFQKWYPAKLARGE